MKQGLTGTTRAPVLSLAVFDASPMCLFVLCAQLSAASTALALTRSEQQRQLQATRDQLAGTVTAAEHSKVKDALLEAERRIATLETTLSERIDETNQLIAGAPVTQQSIKCRPASAINYTSCYHVFDGKARCSNSYSSTVFVHRFPL